MDTNISNLVNRAVKNFYGFKQYCSPKWSHPFITNRPLVSSLLTTRLSA